jgi:rhodanese-related sulfurtransferase
MRVLALAAGLTTLLLAASTAAAQEPKGEFVDGEFVEGYVYVPEFISPEEVKRHVENPTGDDLLIVDTAAPLIWQDERIPGAVNFPRVNSISLPVGLPREKTLVLYCACNDHEDSIDMAKKLSQLGYLKVKVLQGGWFKWLDLGYPTEGEAVKGEVKGK